MPRSHSCCPAAVAVVGLAIGIIVWNLATPDRSERPNTPTASSATAAPVPGGGPPREEPGAAESPTPTGHDSEITYPRGWKTAANQWAAAFCNTSGGKQTWLRRLKPWVTEHLYQGYRQTDLTNLPAGPVIDKKLYRPNGAQTEAYIAYADGTKVAIMIQYDGFGPNGWRIAKTAPIDNT